MCFIEQSFYFNVGPLFLKKILRKGKINKYFGSYMLTVPIFVISELYVTYIFIPCRNFIRK